MPKKNTNIRQLLPTQAKSIRKGAIMREQREKADEMRANNQFRNQFLAKTKAKNYEMERDRLNGILAQNRLINNRERQLLQSRANVLNYHVNYLEPIIGYQGQYTHV